ncbi:MAG: hypothetical protein JRN19_04320 [Nitrososphaerota archaeon]|nr:hypothetical protein [Nitrososphaerota archaeon]MDG7048945.1 hypothetical protein [Nitrososphaerota archaeon]MDG7051657.1 hypothetical protein [Nitrososphaerota archaeon]
MSSLFMKLASYTLNTASPTRSRWNLSTLRSFFASPLPIRDIDVMPPPIPMLLRRSVERFRALAKYTTRPAAATTITISEATMMYRSPTVMVAFFGLCIDKLC